MNRTIRINLWTILTLVLLASLVLPWTAFAAVWTDKLDYMPGETVTILGDNSDGAGYIPGETVDVDVVGPNDYTAECAGVAADTDNADWSCQVTLWDSDLAYGTYYYTATGRTSGVVEQGTFTDWPWIEARLQDCQTHFGFFVLGEKVCAFAGGLGSHVDATIEWWSPHSDPAGPATLATTFKDVNGNVDDSLELNDTYAELGEWTIKLYVNGEFKAFDTFTVIPDVTIVSPSEDYAVFDITSAVDVTYSWTDPPDPPGWPDTFDCTVDWGDGTDPETLDNCTSSQTTAHDYTEAGLYEITITVRDDHEGEGVASIVVVVYDPDAGFVTGGGWFESPFGAYRPIVQAGGKATFGFVSKYHRGATVPEGETEFQFHVAYEGWPEADHTLSFHSESYDWLVINNDGTNAQYKGEGTIDGKDGVYNFMLWATDGETVLDGTDTFRIKIWPSDPEVGRDPIYDNCQITEKLNICDEGYGQPIDEGTIIVRGKKE